MSDDVMHDALAMAAARTKELVRMIESSAEISDLLSVMRLARLTADDLQKYANLGREVTS